ncbi:MAG: hypothetical protein OXU81_11095 [Gammaproteobacteria bacterium]|nr:hypothetical protein [Gammaproteobacteria bacterium]
MRSTLPEAEAAVPARVRAPEHGAVRSEVRVVLRRSARTSGDTGEARSAAATRGDHGGPADDAVDPCRHGAGPATAVSAASRRASGARSERSERRREGYPPEGPRPRSGLGRVARSRSDAPRLIVCIGEPVSIFGTVITITVCTIGFTGTIGAGIVGNSTDTVDCRDVRVMPGRA